MAKRIVAINMYRPQLELGSTVQMDELIRYLTSRTGLSRGQVSLVLNELSDAVTFFNRAGRGVKLERLGTYLPSIQLDGSFDIEHRTGRELKDSLNAPGTFTGSIRNKANIGKGVDELIGLWNSEHADDPVEGSAVPQPV